MMGEGATSVAFANGFASGAIAPTSPMLINVIELQTNRSNAEDRFDGRRAPYLRRHECQRDHHIQNAETGKYHFTRIAAPENRNLTLSGGHGHTSQQPVSQGARR